MTNAACAVKANAALSAATVQSAEVKVSMFE